ncbi:MAG: PHP domain-containing protein [Deltaproteobacteria bacterium]|nr:PHP domain-containing protein [Deltaproteobacteria bacterium]
MGYVDLHTHSTASDGSLTPTELVTYAVAKGLTAIALTDHDTTEGLDEAINAGNNTGLEVVPGIEISAQYEAGTMHILGYFIDPGNAALRSNLARLQEARRTRNPRILEKLAQLGVHITIEDVEEASGGGQIGRPHIAQAIVKKGYANDVNYVFDNYLTKGGPAYVDKFRFSPEDSISLIKSAGGRACLGHPFTLFIKDNVMLDQMVAGLKARGLEAIEVYYPDHSPEQTATFLHLAKKYDLFPTGGSDFHGRAKPRVDLGIGYGALRVPYELLDHMRS